MKPLLLTASCSLLTLLVGCGSPDGGQRVALDSLAVGTGGAAAWLGGNKDPALTTAGAVGGFVVSEAFQSMARSGRQKAYNSGVEEGRAIGQEQVLKGLWEESNGLPTNSRSPGPLLTVPGRVQNGVLYDAHTVVPGTLPERVLIQPAGTNAVPRPHYEILSPILEP